MNALIRTLIVDDEPPARSRLRALVKDVAQIRLIGEAGNGKDAVEAIRQYEPDLVLLDIQMPDMDGFAVIDALAGERLPFIIFITAYDQYALKAFDVHAVDYVLKPIDDDRFFKAVNHAIEQIRHSHNRKVQEQMLALLESMRAPDEGPITVLIIQDQGTEFHIPIEEIDYIESSGNYVLVHRGKDRWMHRATMVQMQDNLDTRQFMRIHRSFLVNRYAIRKVNYRSNNVYSVQLKSGAKLTSGRHYKEALEQYLAQ